ncbi:MAG: hypothetical protein OXE45_15515 [bacterium]|nr:hypothetical protein [bacterium]
MATEDCIEEDPSAPDPHGDIAAGRYTRYLNSEEFLASFEEDA